MVKQTQDEALGKEAYLLGLIERTSTALAKSPSFEELVRAVELGQGVGVNPFTSDDLTAEVKDVIIDLFFDKKIKTDMKKGLVVVKESR